MQELQNQQNYHVVASPQFSFVKVFGTDSRFTPGIAITAPPDATRFNSLRSLSIPHFDILPKIESPKLAEYLLTQAGVIYAQGLVFILGELAKFNPNAISPIMSILDLYIEPTPIIDFHIPPKSSRELTIEVTMEGKVTQVQ